MNTKRFKIGDWVRATAETVSYKLDRKRTVTVNKFDPPRIGQVVGISRRHEGTVKGGGWYGEEYDAHLQITKTVLVWLVRFTLRGREVAVQDSDLTAIEGECPKRLPTQNYGKIDDKDREYLRQIMKNWEREPNGRWKKAGDKPCLK